MRSVVTSPTMKQVLEEPVELTQAEVDNDQKLDEHILRHLTSIYHFFLDLASWLVLRTSVWWIRVGAVCGVRGIRVAYASIYPVVPASNTMWTTVIFAEMIGSANAR